MSVQRNSAGELPTKDGLLPLKDYKPSPLIWNGWTTVGFSAAIFMVFFAAQTLVAVVFMAVLIARHSEIVSLTELQTFIIGLQSNGLLLSIAIIVSGICGLFMVGLFIRIRHGYSFKEYLELRAPEWGTWLSLIGVMAALVIFSVFMDRVHSDPKTLKMMSEAYLSSGWPPIFWIASVIFAPVFEETFFRGFLFVGLSKSRIGPLWTVIITATAFAALHSLQYDLFNLTIILVLGLVFGLVRFLSKSLWSTIALHSAWNLMSMISLALYVKGLT